MLVSLPCGMLVLAKGLAGLPSRYVMDRMQTCCLSRRLCPFLKKKYFDYLQKLLLWFQLPKRRERKMYRVPLLPCLSSQTREVVWEMKVSSPHFSCSWGNYLTENISRHKIGSEHVKQQEQSKDIYRQAAVRQLLRRQIIKLLLPGSSGSSSSSSSNPCRKLHLRSCNRKSSPFVWFNQSPFSSALIGRPYISPLWGFIGQWH